MISITQIVGGTAGCSVRRIVAPPYEYEYRSGLGERKFGRRCCVRRALTSLIGKTDVAPKVLYEHPKVPPDVAGQRSRDKRQHRSVPPSPRVQCGRDGAAPRRASLTIRSCPSRQMRANRDLDPPPLGIRGVAQPVQEQVDAHAVQQHCGPRSGMPDQYECECQSECEYACEYWTSTGRVRYGAVSGGGDWAWHDDPWGTYRGRVTR
jgi:hypothetical protein